MCLTSITRLCSHQSQQTFHPPTSKPIYSLMHTFTRLSIHPSIRQPIHPSIHHPIHSFIHLPTHPTIYMPQCDPVNVDVFIHPPTDPNQSISLSNSTPQALIVTHQNQTQLSNPPIYNPFNYPPIHPFTYRKRCD